MRLSSLLVSDLPSGLRRRQEAVVDQEGLRSAVTFFPTHQNLLLPFHVLRSPLPPTQREKPQTRFPAPFPLGRERALSAFAAGLFFGERIRQKYRLRL